MSILQILYIFCSFSCFPQKTSQRVIEIEEIILIIVTEINLKHFVWDSSELVSWANHLENLVALGTIFKTLKCIIH